MTITDVKIRKIFEDGAMKAVASVTFDGELALHDIKLIDAKGKLFIVMPSHRMADGTFRDTCHPIKSEFRRALETAVIEEYQREIEASSAL